MLCRKSHIRFHVKYVIPNEHVLFPYPIICCLILGNTLTEGSDFQSKGDVLFSSGLGPVQVPAHKPTVQSRTNKNGSCYERALNSFDTNVGIGSLQALAIYISVV